MSDLNSCCFIGRLGKDPETRYSPDGSAVCGFSIAVGSQWKNKAGEKQDATEWVNITAFGKLAEICAEYLKKGSKIYLSGRMKTEKYTSKEGVEKYSVKIIAEKMQMLDGKPDAAERPTERPAASPVPDSSDGFGNFDDSIPF